MLNPIDIDINKGEFTDQELEALGQLVLKARDIGENQQLSRTIEDFLNKKTKKIKNLADLRKKANDLGRE